MLSKSAAQGTTKHRTVQYNTKDEWEIGDGKEMVISFDKKVLNLDAGMETSILDWDHKGNPDSNISVI